MTRASQRGGTWVLSPHFDDAALSVGGALAAAVFPPPLTLYTVFGVSNYTRGEFHRESDQVTRRRREEDRRFAESVGARVLHGEFLEAGLRIASDFDAIFRGGSHDACPPPAFPAALQAVIRAGRPDVLLCPAALGEHWDHVLVLEAVRAHEPDPRALLLFYEDLPYAGESGPEAAARALNRLDATLHPCWVPINLADKLAGLAHYPSQLGPEEIERVREYSQRLGESAPRTAPVERLWTCAPRERAPEWLEGTR